MFWNSKDKQNYPGYPDKLPGTLRPGAILSIEEGELLRYEGLDLVKPLPRGELVVDAVSSTDLLGLRVARAYVRQGEAKIVFQFNQNTEGVLLDVNCFTLLQEVFPGSVEDWETWIGENGLIGGPDLTSPDAKTYARDWGDGTHANPVEAEEKIFPDPSRPPFLSGHKMMLYARDLADAREYLLVSADEEPEQALVRIWAGVVLSPQTVTVY